MRASEFESKTSWERAKDDNISLALKAEVIAGEGHLYDI
jgi:hypothetical protein